MNVKGIFRKIQMLSSVATIVIAILLSIVTAKMFFPTSPSVRVVNMPKQETDLSKASASPIGKTIRVEDIDWKSSKKTLVLYISTTCHYCDESSPFYQRLVEKYVDDTSMKIVAILPQTVEEGKDHLRSLGLKINDVYSAQLSSIGVNATPTLLLADDAGVVLDMWRGKLSNEREKDVLDRISN